MRTWVQVSREEIGDEPSQHPQHVFYLFICSKCVRNSRSAACLFVIVGFLLVAAAIVGLLLVGLLHIAWTTTSSSSPDSVTVPGLGFLFTPFNHSAR
jgi:hypothetical protein